MQVEAAEILGILGEAKANFNLADTVGMTPAHYAADLNRATLADAKADFITPTGAFSAPLQLALDVDDYHSVCIMLASMPPEQSLSEAIVNKLQSARTKITDELVKNLANLDDRSNIVAKLLRQEDKLGNILNTPTNTFLFFFTRNKFGDRKITGSMHRLVSEYGVSEENKNLIPTPPSP